MRVLRAKIKTMAKQKEDRFQSYFSTHSSLVRRMGSILRKLSHVQKDNKPQLKESHTKYLGARFLPHCPVLVMCPESHATKYLALTSSFSFLSICEIYHLTEVEVFPLPSSILCTYSVRSFAIQANSFPIHNLLLSLSLFCLSCLISSRGAC